MSQVPAFASYHQLVEPARYVYVYDRRGSGSTLS